MRPAWLLAGVAVLACAAGCADAQTAAAPSSSAPPPSSAVPSPSSSAPPPPSTSAPATTRTTTPPPTSSEAVPTGGDCGTVPAASGLTLRVLDSSAMGIPCADATNLVAKFQRQITGKQPPGSAEPVNATVDGWLCVSGAPAAQGGTSCSRGEQTVFAEVAAE